MTRRIVRIARRIVVHRVAARTRGRVVVRFQRRHPVARLETAVRVMIRVVVIYLPRMMRMKRIRGVLFSMGVRYRVVARFTMVVNHISPIFTVVVVLTWRSV